MHREMTLCRTKTEGSFCILQKHLGCHEPIIVEEGVNRRHSRTVFRVNGMYLSHASLNRRSNHRIFKWWYSGIFQDEVRETKLPLSVPLLGINLPTEYLKKTDGSQPFPFHPPFPFVCTTTSVVFTDFCEGIRFWYHPQYHPV